MALQHRFPVHRICWILPGTWHRGVTTGVRHRPAARDDARPCACGAAARAHQQFLEALGQICLALGHVPVAARGRMTVEVVGAYV